MNGAYAGIPQSRPNQVLYVVTFKCCRADIFYISEGTGLHVKPGDLVVVEADRGTDLGTVAVADVPWQKAKDLKEQYSDEHYKWLMMFSQSNQNAISNGIDPVANSPTGNVSAIGGMGPQGGQNGMQEPASGELKPKMIKRLAQQHEIQSLRDKEGNEARAKRVCQQKVVEHGLQMEILDAEFQM
jgi:cell fate regulator YaaT (PSP1 superfamily)